MAILFGKINNVLREFSSDNFLQHILGLICHAMFHIRVERDNYIFNGVCETISLLGFQLVFRGIE